MRTALCLGWAARTALAIAAIFAAGGCGSLDRSVARNHCATSSQCNQGHVCVAGICQAPTDAEADRQVDAPTQDPVAGADASVDAPIPPPADAGIDAPEAPASTGVDASDAPADDVLGPEPAQDTGVDVPRGPCATGPGQESPAATSGLLAALPGLWRLCAASAAIDPDMSWLIGSTPIVQLDARNWWRCTDGQPPSCGATAQGLYFRVLEGSNSVFHFADQAFSGGGADISIRYFAGSKLLQLTACDGAIHCSSNVTYLVYVGPSPGS